MYRIDNQRLKESVPKKDQILLSYQIIRFFKKHFSHTDSVNCRLAVLLKTSKYNKNISHPVVPLKKAIIYFSVCIYIYHIYKTIQGFEMLMVRNQKI